MNSAIHPGNFEMLSCLTELDLCGLFKASALWADAFYKSKCPSVRVCVCPSVEFFVVDNNKNSEIWKIVFRYILIQEKYEKKPFKVCGCLINQRKSFLGR